MRDRCLMRRFLGVVVLLALLATLAPQPVSMALTDTVPPSAVIALSASTGSSDGSVDLSWTAPGDDGNTGTASAYVVRYNPTNITDSNWGSSTDITGEPQPGLAGSAENMTVTGLTPRQAYYFAIKTSDEVPNTSGVSNSPRAVAGSSRSSIYLPVVVSNATGESNNPPNSPFSPYPASGASGQSTGVVLSWSGGDLDGDAVSYDVYLEPNDLTPDVLVSDDQTGLAYDPPTLAAGTHYYWQIVATDEHAASTAGPVWDFTTTGGGPGPGEMVLVPAGSFQMGCDPDHNFVYSCSTDQLPLHTITLDAYTIDKYEVTNAQYADFLNAMGNQEEGGGTWLDTDRTYERIHYNGAWQAEAGYADHPVIAVSWYGARAYCQWAGKRLPTEAEWEKAARGAADTRAFPWGDDLAGCSLANLSTCVLDTTPVGSYPTGASPYGAMDMAGNVYEWVNDWYSSTYYSSSPASNPPGPGSGTWKVLRGGSFGYGSASALAADRGIGFQPSRGDSHYGFRCAAAAPGP